MEASPRARFRSSVADVVSAGVCAVLALAGVVMLPILERADPGSVVGVAKPGSPGWWVIAGVLLVQALALVPVREFPRAMLLVVAAAPVALVVLAPGPAFSLTSVAVLVAVFRASVVHPGRHLRWVLLAMVLLVAASQGLNDLRSGSPFSATGVTAAALQAVVVVGTPLLIAQMIAARREARAARDREMRALAREHAALIDAAVSRERTAMSRELHDIAAHHMSGIALMAAAMDRQIDADPEAAKLSARQVRVQSRDVLDDLRKIVGLLRDDSEGTRTVEGLAAVRELVEGRHASGMAVVLEVVTAAGASILGAGIGPLAQLVVYRMIQEALANAAMHAPGAHCVVRIDDGAPDRLTAVVSNDAFHGPDPGPGGGFGLLGIRERAELVGAELHYGTTDQGGWEVRLSVPRDDTAHQHPTSPTTSQENA